MKMKSSLYQRRWNPDSRLTGRHRSIYLVHGISEHSGRYDDVGRWLAARGWIVGAHDHHGFGRSGGTRGRLRSANAYVDDLVQCLAQFAAESGSRPVLLGHSMGGVIAAASVLTRSVDVAGLCLSAPAFRPALSRSQRWQLRTLGAIAPRFVIERSLDPRKLSHDPAVVAAYRSDPLVHGFVSAQLVQWIIDAGADCLARVDQLTVPTLIMASAADPVVNPDGFREFAAKVPPGLLTQRWYNGYLHEVLNEEASRRGQVYAELLAWLESIA
ncbi:MAG: lysophospholipase [Burkholderiaceae bacterium]